MILLAAFLLCLIWPSSVPDPFGVGSALSWSLLCLLAAGPILCVAAVRRCTPRTPLDIIVATYGAAVLATWPTAYDGYQTLVAVVALAGNVALFYSAAILARRSLLMPRLVLIILVVGIAVLELLAADFHFQVGPLSRPTDYPQPAGWSGYPELGLLAAIAFAIGVAVSQMAQPWWSRAALLLLTAVSLLELAFLYSRLAWVSVAGVLLAAVAVAVRTRRFVGVAATVLVAVLVGGLLVAQNSTIQRLATDLVGLKPSLTSQPGVVLNIAPPAMRVAIWRRTLRMIGDYPVAGVGLGNFQAVYEPGYNPEPNDDGRRGVHAHNLWLHQTAELGVVGGVAYLFLWIAVLAAGWTRSRFSPIDQAFFYIVVAIAVRSLGDNMFFGTGGAPARLQTLTWLCFGTIAGRYGGVDTFAETRRGAEPVPSHRESRRWRRAVLPVLCALAVAGELYGLFLRDTDRIEVTGRKPTVLREFGAGAAVAQTFSMVGDGLRSIRVQISSDRPVSLRVACEVFRRTDGPPGEYERVFISTTKVKQGAGRAWHSFTFPPIQESAARGYKFQLQSLGPPPPDAAKVGLVASLDDALPGDTLVTGEREQWGDLVFEAHGARMTAYDWFRLHTTSALPAPLRPVPIQLLLLLAYNGALVIFAYRMKALAEAGRGWFRPDREPSVESGPNGHLGALVPVAMVAAAIATVAVVVTRDRARPTETIAVDLVEEFDAAVKRTQGPLHQTFAINNDGPGRAIFAHPPSEIVWKTRIPSAARLRAWLELTPPAWDRSTDGVVFRIGVAEGETYTGLMTEHVDPMHVPEDRRPRQVDIDLSGYAGREVEIIFATDASLPGRRFDPSYDWALWRAPRIVAAR